MPNYISFTLVEILLYITTRWTALAQESPVFIATPKYCITNSASAMSFITLIDDPKSVVSQISRFYPQQSDSSDEINCKFEKNDDCINFWISNKWRTENSLEGKINQKITDRRWEELPLIKTEYVDTNGQELNYYHVANFSPRRNIRIPFSVRIFQDAHVFLCNGTKVNESSCYWIMLKAWRGQASALRKCHSRQICAKYGEWPQPPCTDNMTVISHKQNSDAFLKHDKWSHFEITKKDNKLVLYRNDEEIFSYTDPEPFSPNNIFFYSIAVNGLWKLHRYTYIYTDTQDVLRGPNIRVKKGENCISMFIVTCAKCQMTFEIELVTSKLQLYYDSFITTDEKWTEIKIYFSMDNQNEKFATLLVTTAITSITLDKFWGIDDVRACQAKEFRILETDNESPCQLIRQEEPITVDGSATSNISINCEENTLGSHCVPCSIINNRTTCDNFKYCELIGRKKVCYCTSGFHTRTCDVVPGPVRNLIVHNITSTEISLKWEPPNDQKDIRRYIVWYKRIKGKQCATDSTEVTNDTMIVQDSQAVLQNLKPYSVYEIRVAAETPKGRGNETILVENTIKKDVVDKQEIPEIRINDVKNNYTNLGLTINCDQMQGPIVLNVKVECKTEWCFSKGYSKEFAYNFAPISLGELYPYVNYTATIYFNRKFGVNYTDRNIIAKSQNFTTLPARPNQVADVTVFSKNDSSISLRWLPPYPPTGILNMYKISYTEDKFSERDFKHSIETKPIQCKLWPNYHCTTITKEIKKDQRYYNIEIWARNESPPKFINVSQNVLETWARTGEPNPPINPSAFWGENNTLQVLWQHPNVTNGVVKEFIIQLMVGKQKTKKTYPVASEDDYNITYSYMIPDPGLPWCSSYRLEMKTNNTEFTSHNVSFFEDWSPPSLPAVETNIETRCTNYTITVQIPKLKKTKHGDEMKTKLYMLAFSKMNDEAAISNEIKSFEESLRNNSTEVTTTRFPNLVFERDNIFPDTYQIGNGSALDFQGNKFWSSPLKSGVEYSIHLIYVNDCRGVIRILRLDANAMTEDPKVTEKAGEDDAGEDHNNGLYALVMLLFVIPLAVYIFWNWNKEVTSNRLKEFAQSSNEESGDDTLHLTEKPPIMPKPRIRPHIEPLNKNCILKTTHSKPIRISEYETYVKDAIQSGELERQLALFPRGQTKPWDYGSLIGNKTKNRYKNLIAYDHTRVKLRKIAGVEYSDYINANYIDGYRSPKAYIATQGPKMATLNDFWRMVWQNNVKNIVMLANTYEGGKKKVEKYWPDINEEKDFNNIRVQYVSSDVFADYEYRVFNISNNGEQRKVEQLHFTSWPDHGVPLYSQSLVPFLQRILKIGISANHPIVVHCSAGVGRTGTIILCDICLRMAANEGVVDFLANLEHLRSQRPNMVDNIEQYKLAHLVVLECLFGMDTNIMCGEDMSKTVETLINSNKIPKLMKYLDDTEWQDKAMDTVWEVDEPLPVYPEKNRIKDIVPDQHHRVFLSRYPPEDEKSSYINAVFVDGFRSPNRFIVTQQPMPNTFGDFWRLVSEKNSTVIISLNEINPKDKTSCRFWPKHGTEMKPVDYLTVNHVKTTECKYYNLILVHLTDQKEKYYTPITIVSMKDWMPRDLLPNSIENFLSFWEESDVIARKSSPVIITCYDGATASGLYIAMSFVIEKMKLEHVCDVCLAVRNIRHNRAQFVTSEEQFEFLLRTSATYISGFQSYANFS